MSAITRLYIKLYTSFKLRHACGISRIVGLDIPVQFWYSNTAQFSNRPTTPALHNVDDQIWQFAVQIVPKCTPSTCNYLLFSERTCLHVNLSTESRCGAPTVQLNVQMTKHNA